MVWSTLSFAVITSQLKLYNADDCALLTVWQHGCNVILCFSKLIHIKRMKLSPNCVCRALESNANLSLSAHRPPAPSVCNEHVCCHGKGMMYNCLDSHFVKVFSFRIVCESSWMIHRIREQHLSSLYYSMSVVIWKEWALHIIHMKMYRAYVW